ncbi:ATP-binding protein [Pseudorhodoplanes sp.]|uniref:HAMP domain-containing sensor histidine kinase n=1 Tax=Pseudorhodoplanes sp. TaxID=1934341 RepID=UPI00391A6A4A
MKERGYNHLMKRLYLKIYLTIVVALLSVVIVSGAIWRFGKPPGPVAEGFEVAGELLSGVLPPADAPAAAQQTAIRQFAQRLQVNVALFDKELKLVASYGEPPPPPLSRRPGWMPTAGGAAWNVPLPDGRWIVATAANERRHPAIGLILLLGGIALIIALCAFPVVRGLTRRLERLQQGVETLGAGNLSSRVKVEGCDEVARLAGSFNRAAERIEELVNAHKLMLAHASHELRTPLARIRLGIEMLGEDGDAKNRVALNEDIAELDGLIDAILLASRLDMTKTLPQPEDVDLLALVAEEAAHFDDCTVDGAPLTVTADRRFLRHLIRNLLENADRHGKPPVTVTVARDGRDAIVDVCDSGAGIPEGERERIFTPFYRLNGETKGSGLGLSIARQIARLHGGEVAVVQRSDTQSCIRVSLPVTSVHDRGAGMGDAQK